MHTNETTYIISAKNPGGRPSYIAPGKTYRWATGRNTAGRFTKAEALTHLGTIYREAGAEHHAALDRLLVVRPTTGGNADNIVADIRHGKFSEGLEA